MPKVDLYNIDGKKVGDIELKEEIFGIEPNEPVVHEAVVNFLANQRQGTQSTKTRSEVRGGGRKPWKQKGTGRARQGSIRATQWRGGGIVFGPTPRSYSKKMNRKERRLALKSALSYKVKDNELIIIDELKFDSNKTKQMVELLSKLNLTNRKVLIVLEELEENVFLAARNLANLKVVDTNHVGVLDLVSADNLLITESALKKLEEVLDNE